MGTQVQMQEVIWDNIKDLPKDRIREILDFIVFVRTKTFHPQLLEKPALQDSIHHHLSVLDEAERNHLELEFNDYQVLYPHE